MRSLKKDRSVQPVHPSGAPEAKDKTITDSILNKDLLVRKQVDGLIGGYFNPGSTDRGTSVKVQ
jgi:hypothetical protein